MTPTRPALTMSALAVLGCGSRADDAGLTRPRPRLSMTPPDQTSAVGATPVQVAVDNYADAVGAALLAPIANTVTGVGGRPVRGAGLTIDFPPVAFEPGDDCPIAAVTPE